MIEFTQAERQALAFAQSHDWGELAFIEDGQIKNLIDSWTRVDPETGERTEGEIRVCRPATVSALRDFGGY